MQCPPVSHESRRCNGRTERDGEEEEGGAERRGERGGPIDQQISPPPPHKHKLAHTVTATATHFRAHTLAHTH